MNLRPVTFDQNTARKIIRAIRIMESSGAFTPGMLQKALAGVSMEPEDPILVKNVSGSIVPPYACMQVTGTTNETNGPNYLNVDQPADTNGDAGYFVFNGGEGIEVGGFGEAQKGLANIRAKKASGTVTAGDHWGPTVSAWTIQTLADGPFIAAGEDDIATNVLKISIALGSGGGSSEFARIFLTGGGGIPARSGTTMGSATVTQYTTSSGVLSAGSSFTVYNLASSAFGASAYGVANLVDSDWVAVMEDCG